MNTQPVLTVVIPTWNNLDQLSWCLQSLFTYTDFPLNVIVIDNAGKGEVQRRINNQGLPINVVNAEENLGWMKAINLGLDMTETPLFCMMNDDVIFLPGHRQFWRTLTQHFSDPKVGSVGPSSNFVAGCQSITQLDTPLVFETSLLIGFCKIVRTQVLKDLGGLDEHLPGGDDLDLSIRMLGAGYKMVCDKTAYLHHFGQQTGKRVKGQDWDSIWNQEMVTNALIRKHSVQQWYEVYQAQWDHLDHHVTAIGDPEHVWIKNQLEPITREGGKGLNVGAGASRYEGALNVDHWEGVHVAGGMKGQESKPDIVADAADIPLDDESQDFIVAAHIIEHTIDPIKTLHEWKRLLKPNGRLVLTVPNNEKMPTMLIDYTHVHAFNEDSLGNLLQTVGFDVTEKKTDAMGAIRCLARRVA